MLSVTDETLQLISKIYDVGLSTRHWQGVLDRTADHLGGMSSALLYEDKLSEELTAGLKRFGSFWQGEKVKKYLAEVIRDDPSARLVKHTSPGDIVTSENISMPEKLRIAPFAFKMRRMFGIRALAASRLNDMPHWFDYITVQYGEQHGPMNEDEMVQMQLLLPHLSKAMEISRPIALLEQRYRTVLDALDRFHVGVAIISKQHSLVVSNLALRKALEQSDGFVLSHKESLACDHPATAALLRRAIDDAIDTSGATSNKNSTLLRIPRRSGKDPYLVEVAPLNDSAGDINAGFHGAMLFCIDPCDTEHVSTEGLQAVYQLTDAESDVCRLLVEGLTYQEIAQTRDVSPETIKSQVQSALRKTRNSNRSELVRLALSVNIPIDRE